MADWLRAAIALLILTDITHAFIEDAVDIIKLGKEIGEEVFQSWDLIKPLTGMSDGVELPIMKRRERVILSRLAHVSRSIDKLELNLEKTGAVVAMLAKHAGRGARLELRLNEISDLLNRVSNSDRIMREYVDRQDELESVTLESFATWCVSPSPISLMGLLERIHSLVVPAHNHLLGRGLLQLILDDLKLTAETDSKIVSIWADKDSKSVHQNE